MRASSVSAGRLAALVACGVSVAPSLPAPPGRPEERVEVALRLIDVTVLDSRHRPLPALGPEDFVVTVAGTERAIASFDRAATDEPAATDDRIDDHRDGQDVARHRRWVAICLDVARIPPTDREVVLQTASGMIRRARAEDRFAVALLRDGDLDFFQPFAPAGAIDLSGLGITALLGRDPDLHSRVDEMVRHVRTCRGQRDPTGCAATRTEEFLAVARRQREEGIRALRGLVAALAPLPGRKALVWLSGGFMLQPGEVVLEALTRELDAAPQLLSRLQYGETSDFETLLTESTDARVSFFSLRAGHDTGHALRGADQADVPRPVAGEAGDPYALSNRMGEETLRDAAEATGGRAVLTPLGRDATAGLLDRLDAIYTLGIRALPEDRPGARVKVRLREGKGRVLVRRGLAGSLPDRSRPVATLEPLPERVGAEVGAILALSLRNLGRETVLGPRRLALYGCIRTDAGQVVGEVHTILEVPPDSGDSAELRHPVLFEAPAGRYTLEVTVSDLVTHGRATARVRL